MTARKEFQATTLPAGPDASSNPYLVRAPEPTPEHELTTDLKRTHIKPLARAQRPFDIVIPPGWILHFTWGIIKEGDCHMYTSNVFIYPDGQIFFYAYTRTSSSGDVWIIHNIKFTDAHGHQIGNLIGKHDSQTMAWEDSDYPFSFSDQITGASPQAITQITGATMNNSC
jgi:hypothetical protein